MDVEQVRKMFLYVSEQMLNNIDLLTEIDSKIGDGDHGIGMEIGFSNVKKELEKNSYEWINDIFYDIGMTMLRVMGGASGVLFGTVFLSGISKYPKKKEFTLFDFSNVFMRATQALKERGKAQIGDKTMIDALEPAVTMLDKMAKEEKNLQEGFVCAANEAKKGMLYTKECQARFGRAKYYGEKAIGYQDAGATSVFIIFQSMSEWISKNVK